MSQKIALLVHHEALAMRDKAEVFLYATRLEDDDNTEATEEITKLWTEAMQLADQRDQTQQSSMNQEPQATDWEAELAILAQLWTQHHSHLSLLQAFLVLHHVLYGILVPLINNTKDNQYAPAAAGYAEALALSPYCNQDHEDMNTTCLGQSLALALQFYQQAEDVNGIRRIQELQAQQEQPSSSSEPEL
uniref:KIF-binding protein n=1 Tax=Entomoneis paludosa TaxID=265537 RepID=A0A7S2Y8J0_9STRA